MSEKKVIEKKAYVAIARGHKILSSRSCAQRIFLVNSFQDVCLCHKTNIKLFLLIDIIHLFCYFKNYFKAVLPAPAKRSVNWRNKHALDRCSRNDLKGNSSQLYLLNEYGDLYFLLQISDHYIVGKNQRKFKKKIMSTFISRESP